MQPTQQLIPEIQEAVDQIEAAVSQAEADVEGLKETIKQKRREIKRWHRTAETLRNGGRQEPSGQKRKKKTSATLPETEAA